MFEKLAGNVLSRILSKYFTEESLAQNKATKTAHLGIWSGYISLRDLQVKVDIINEKIRRKGHPLELVHCSIRQVEITIPWAKYGTNGLSRSNSMQEAVAVLVLDGVHALFRTTFSFYDDDLRAEEIKKRREALSRSENFAKSSPGSDDDEDFSFEDSKTYTEMLKKRITSGLLQEILDKLHIHIRDFHVRIEDTESDPKNPCAFGITMESMHVQDGKDECIDQPSDDNVVSKFAQINHFAVYWNALDCGDNLPVENSILHRTCAGIPAKISQALDFCIVRRCSLIASPSRKSYIPTHTFLLLPVGGRLYFVLSNKPKDLSLRPAVEIDIELDCISTNLRDFQCIQMLRLYKERKNFQFVKKYRKFRPRNSVLDDPKAWWLYAARVINLELRDNFLRWSRSRFQRTYAIRTRYMSLYERRIRNSSSVNNSSPADTNGYFVTPLNTIESKEIQEIEDGVHGELSITDIILYRAIVNMRMEKSSNGIRNDGSRRNRRSYWWTDTVRDATVDDVEAREEFDRLLQYLDKVPSNNDTSRPEVRNDSLVAISVNIQVEEVRFVLFSPLYITAEETQLKRLHEKFLEFVSQGTKIGGTLRGDYKNFGLEFSVVDFTASEVRMDKSQHVVACQLKRELVSLNGSDDITRYRQNKPLFLVTFMKNPVTNPGVNKELRVLLNPIELNMNLDCQWLGHLKGFMREVSTARNVEKFWGELSLAYLNSLTLGKLALMAKAESAASDHENLDVDISMHCPVLRFSMGGDEDLVIDLGMLSIKTDRLAGISRNILNSRHLIQHNEDLSQDGSSLLDQRQYSTDESSVNGSRSSRIPSSVFRTSLRKPMPNLAFSSAMSVDSIQASERGNRSFSGSLNVDDAFPSIDRGSDRKNSHYESSLEELFYDKYQLVLHTGRITFCGESEIFDISTGFELRTTIQKSVIPTDHTLCKMKAHTSVETIKIVLNEGLISRLGVAFKQWKYLINVDVASQTYRSAVSKPIISKEVGKFVTSLVETTSESDSDSSGSASEIDDNEFFDAKEGPESIGGENGSGVWFEDNWIVDAESVIDGVSRGSSNDRRSHRRQPSLSDVSSMSDHSKNRRNHFDNGYLNAENLARLEEGVGEDDSVAESGKEMDDDSFHSVMSAGGQLQLLTDLKESIAELETKIKNLSMTLVEDTNNLTNINGAELRERRIAQKKTKQDMHRSKAELKALKAVCYDMDVLLSDKCNTTFVSELDKEEFTVITMQQARTAKALIRSKQRSNSVGNDDSCHKLVRHLNRELFKGSILLSEIQITIRAGDHSSDIFDDTNVSEFEFVANQVALALFHYANDTKIYLSLDQVAANVSNLVDVNEMPPAVIFSGGSCDTLLPVHLPHLVAHSMEDRFIRGVLAVRKHRSGESTRRVTESRRIRLVIGDVEVSPSCKSIMPILQSLHRVKAAMVSSHSDFQTTDTPGPETGKRSKQLKISSHQYSDLAIRLTSVRLALTHENQVIGAMVVSESSLRMLLLSSQLRNRFQVDFRCANAQLLDITNIETGRGIEIIGRRDPYSSLFQLRLRSQLVPSSETGGWVVGADKPEIDTEDCISDVRNVHLGIKISPLSLVASPEALSKIFLSIRELREVFQRPGDASQIETKASLVDRISGNVRLRWRFDFVLRRINIRFPEENKNEWNMSDDIGSKMVVAFSTVLSVQESPAMKDRISIRMGITDISMIRSHDDWPILEPFSIIFELTSTRKLVYSETQNSRVDIEPLLIKAGSPLNEIETVMTRYGWGSIPSRKSNNEKSTLILKVSPLKMNMSVCIIGFMNGILQSFKPNSTDLQEEQIESTQTKNLLPSATSMVGRRQFGLLISFDDIEIQLLRENESKPIAYALRLISFTMTDVTVDYSQGEQVTASVLIRDSALFDLTSGKGIRVIGEDPEARLTFPYFVRIKFYMHLEGIQTIRLHINWGRIQCLVLPSFFRSILDLKEGMKLMRGTSRISAVNPKKKVNHFTRFLHHPNDVNLIVSADAETFECILASKDIIEYVKNGDKDPCGVVTFRWKASLSLAVALDCLNDSSMPWLTLNFDGIFTDEDGINLFKEFSDNYLVNSAGASIQEIGHKLVNAFTSKVNYKLSAFQVLRTNITLMELFDSSQKGFNMIPKICFKISQPIAGEQRITNPIDFMLLYKATGASIANAALNEFSEHEPKLAQLLTLEANFVDILVYMGAKTLGGFSDSFRVSIKPILDMVKTKDGKRANTDMRMPMSTRINVGYPQTPKLLDIIKSSPSICRVQVGGFLVTCVPGGATRLNESPIIKFELSNISSGIAAVPINRILSALPGRRTKHEDNSQMQYITGAAEVMNLTVGGWIAFQVTGHYHNRRLVAWEPFIEPWIADVTFGIDLVEACRWNPITKQEAKLSRTPTESSLIEASEDESVGTGKDRLREIGRLIRSPFQILQSSTSTSKGSPVISHSDLCYLMLSSVARSKLSSALYQSSGSVSETESKLFNTMPSTSPIEWLQGFGKPANTSGSRGDDSPFSTYFVISDRIPLNVNLTGALIENVMGYLDNSKRTASNAIVPHLIRNSSGMTLRFREVLDSDRIKRGETAAKIILANSSEAPLTLKRSLSQTCDPHRAFIYLELGGFEDAVGRLDLAGFDVPKGERSANFSFKASAKIPVDAVGVHRYPLDRNVKTRVDMNDDGSNSRALGWIIVRVALRGSVKVVSIESPFVLKSAADADLLCEVRDRSGLTLVWRCLVPKQGGIDGNGKHDGIVSVPADIVPSIHGGAYRFFVTALSRASSLLHESEIISAIKRTVEVSTPPPFSPKSFGRGLIGEEEIVLPTLASPTKSLPEQNIIPEPDEKVHLTACAVRIGSASFSRVDSSIEVPEQRMIFFRSPLVIRNFLALPITVQVRVKSFSNIVTNDNLNTDGVDHSEKLAGWEELGMLDCGESVPWTGSPSSDQVELRVKFVGTDGDNSRRYPGWSSPVNVPARENDRKVGRSHNSRTFARMKVSDADNVTLNLSVAFDFGNDISCIDQSEYESIRYYCHKFSSATRVASIFVPYWIIDGTHQDLEFFAGSPIAGQLDRGGGIDSDEDSGRKFGNTLGLAELMDNQNFLNTSSGSGFDVLMIGDENAPRLTVRKRLSRNERLLMQNNSLPWSDSIPLQAGQKARHNITVLTPDEIDGKNKSKIDDGQCFDRLVLRSSTVDANSRFGGQLGTKLIHIVNRYSISNETGRDIEIAANTGSSRNLIVSATTSPQPFHFDDSRQIRFRFKEFGWAWSGLFKIRLNRREVTMRIRHKMKGQTIIVTVEVRSTKRSATNLIVFRESSHPPFRLENHTMYPLRFGQALSGLGSEDNDCDSLLLQYQNEDFAWDEPELSRRALLIKASGSIDNPRDIVFGKFLLDKVAPGTVIKLESDLFTAEVVADGPTRVFRVSDASMPRISSVRQGEFDYFRSAPEVLTPLTTSISIRLSYGIGVSVVDFSPKELLYICLEDIELDKKNDNKKDDIRFSIGNIKLNNQLWVTPYPVFLKMGRHIGKNNTRRKNRRHNAFSISWRSSLNTHGGYGNLTLLDWIEVSSEPIFANVDGELAGLIVRMARQVASISSSGEDGAAFHSRDEELKSLLASSGVGENPEDGTATTRTHGSIQEDEAGETLTTAAVAAKLRDSPVYNQLPTPRSGHYLIRNAMRKRKKQPLLSKVQHKFYIERLKISTTRADLSWSGALPGLLSSSLFKALTFERLPMRLRPFSNLHAYGNVEDHLQILRSHYMSIWRVVDVLMGLSSNPTFLLRGVFHTFREGCSSILDSWAFCLKYYSSQLKKQSERDSKFVPIYDDGNPLQNTEHRTNIVNTISSPFINGLALVLKNTSMVISLFSLQMKYSPKSSSTRHTRGLVRSRNPRLFAHLDGKDLLVEYVEGENAGKALLSRVRSGLHLGEGYFYHAEGVRQPKSHFKAKNDIDPAPLILMITLERILLLTGKLDQHFCSVQWEAYFTNIIHIDLMPARMVKGGSAFPFDEIIVWHLSDPEFSVGNKIEKTHKYMKNLVSGIDVLHSKSIFVPHLIGEQVLEKLKLFQSRS